MPTAYYLGFDVCKINANGVMIRQANQVVQVYDLTNSVSLGTIQANDKGVVGAGSFNVAAGTQVKFSVTGFTPFITRTLTNQPEFVAIADIALVIENLYVPTPITPTYNDIYVRNGENSEAIKIGRVAPGETIQIPYNPAFDALVEIYAIARTAQGASDVFDLSKATRLDLTPNRETGTPDFSQNGAAANLQVNFTHTGYSIAKFRKIQYATNNTFTTGLVEKIEGNLNQILSADFNITRDSGSSALAVFVRIAHSTNSTNFSAWSQIREATFANSGGGGGSGGGNPPSDLYGIVYTGGNATLFWANNGGTSSNVIYQNGIEIDNVSSSTDSYSVGLEYGMNTFVVQNDDGSTNEWQYFYNGNEF